VGHGEGESSAKSMGMKLFETSANNESSVDDAFLGLVKLIKEKRDCEGKFDKIQIKEFDRTQMNNTTMNLNNNTANNTNVNTNIRPVIRLANQDYDYLFKFLLLGDSSVGKTSLMNRYNNDIFQEYSSMTIGIDFMIKRIEINNKAVKLQIWDTGGGGERFRSITTTYYRGVHGILLCYAINNKMSFDNVERWMIEIVRSLNNSCCVVVVGTKSDLEAERQVSFAEGKGLADSYGLQFFETSSKLNVNVEDSFRYLTENVLDQKDRPHFQRKGYVHADTVIPLNNFTENNIRNAVSNSERIVQHSKKETEKGLVYHSTCF